MQRGRRDYKRSRSGPASSRRFLARFPFANRGRSVREEIPSGTGDAKLAKPGQLWRRMSRSFVKGFGEISGFAFQLAAASELSEKPFQGSRAIRGHELVGASVDQDFTFIDDDDPVAD